MTAALARLRETGWVRTRHGSASVLRLPRAAAERIAPVQATGDTGRLDVRRAVPAAPHAAYQEAMRRAVERAGPVLAADGEPDAGLPEFRGLVAERYTREGLATRPEQILVTSGARSALALLAAARRPSRYRPSPTRCPYCAAPELGWSAPGSPPTAGIRNSLRRRSPPHAAVWPIWCPTSRTRPVRS